MIELSGTTSATPQHLWSILTDVESWPRWTASVRRATVLAPGPLQLGTRVRVEQPQLPTTTWTVTEFVPGQRFTWTAGNRLLHSEAVHEVTRRDGVTGLRLSLAWSGPLAGLMARLARANGPRYVGMELAGLTAAAEGRR